MRFRTVSQTRQRSDKMARGVRYELDLIDTDNATVWAVYRLAGEAHTQIGGRLFGTREEAIQAARQDYWTQARAS